MARIAIIGNIGGGKSTLARGLSLRMGIAHLELDRLIWRGNWERYPDDMYIQRHQTAINRENWIIDGLGLRVGIEARLARATEVILVDMPLWMHFWLAAERQIKWSSGGFSDGPAAMTVMPSTRDLFETMWEVDRTWMPVIRALCVTAENQGKAVTRLLSTGDLDCFSRSVFSS